MQLVAYLNGDRVDATQMAHDPWRALVNHPLYMDLVLLECGLRASRVTRRGRQFFKHYPGVECSVEHKSESDQHLAMKRALQDRINAVPGWRAEVEHAHPQRAWIADVMAIHTTGRRLAFEVQLSPQSEDEYVYRSQRYVHDGVGPVWVVPYDHDEFRVKLLMIVTGFGKTSDLPEAPAKLMDRAQYQPVLGKSGHVGRAVDAVLHPSFRWSYGTPQHQLEEIARRAEIRAKAAAEHLERIEQAEEAKRIAAENAAAVAAEVTARFVDAAAAPGITDVPPVLSSRRIWASDVRCMKSGHPVLIWLLTEPTGQKSGNWMPRAENFENVRAHVDSWLSAAGRGLARAGIYRLQGPGNRSAFACPICEDVIKGRWITALPPAKWSVIAEGGATNPEAGEVLHRRQPAQPPKTPTKPPTAVQPSNVSEGDYLFIGPKRTPFWISETTNGQEIAERQAAKAARAARMHEITNNPRYRASPNGFRFECTDCGGMFEDDNEGIHANARCLIHGTRSSGWQ